MLKAKDKRFYRIKGNFKVIQKRNGGLRQERKNDTSFMDISNGVSNKNSEVNQSQKSYYL